MENIREMWVNYEKIQFSRRLKEVATIKSSCTEMKGSIDSFMYDVTQLKKENEEINKHLSALSYENRELKRKIYKVDQYCRKKWCSGQCSVPTRTDLDVVVSAVFPLVRICPYKYGFLYGVFSKIRIFGLLYGLFF